MKGKKVYVISQGSVYNNMHIYTTLQEAKNSVDTVWCEHNETPGVYEDESCEWIIHEHVLL